MSEESRFYPSDFMANWPAVRYNAVDVKLSLFQTLAMFFRHGVWVRTHKGFSEPIFQGQPGYDEAIYESAIMFDRRELEKVTTKFSMQ